MLTATRAHINQLRTRRPMTPPTKPPILSKETGVSVGLVALVVIPVGFGWHSMSTKVGDIVHGLDKLNERMGRLADNQEDHVARTSFRGWIRELRALNPEIDIPSME